MKLFVVESGEYDSYQVNAIFLSEAKAKVFAFRYNMRYGQGERSPGRAQVIEWQTSDYQIESETITNERVSAYVVTVYPYVKRVDVQGPSMVNRSILGEDHSEPTSHVYLIEDREGMTGAKAKKIAQDRHAHWKAEQEGIAS